MSILLPVNEHLVSNAVLLFLDSNRQVSFCQIVLTALRTFHGLVFKFHASLISCILNNIFVCMTWFEHVPWSSSLNPSGKIFLSRCV